MGKKRQTTFSSEASAASLPTKSSSHLQRRILDLLVSLHAIQPYRTSCLAVRMDDSARARERASHFSCSVGKGEFVIDEAVRAGACSGWSSVGTTTTSADDNTQQAERHREKTRLRANLALQNGHALRGGVHGESLFL